MSARKNASICILLALLVSPVFAAPKTALSLDLIPLLITAIGSDDYSTALAFGASAEFVLAQPACSVAFSSMYFREDDKKYPEDSYSFLTVYPSFRYYPFKAAPKWLYLAAGPLLFIDFANPDKESDKTHAALFGTCEVGVKFIFGKEQGPFLEPSAGLYRPFGNPDDVVNMWTFLLCLDLGYSF